MKIAFKPILVVVVGLGLAGLFLAGDGANKEQARTKPALVHAGEKISKRSVVNIKATIDQAARAEVFPDGKVATNSQTNLKIRRPLDDPGKKECDSTVTWVDVIKQILEIKNPQRKQRIKILTIRDIDGIENPFRRINKDHPYLEPLAPDVVIEDPPRENVPVDATK